MRCAGDAAGATRAGHHLLARNTELWEAASRSLPPLNPTLVTTPAATSSSGSSNTSKLQPSSHDGSSWVPSQGLGPSFQGLAGHEVGPSAWWASGVPGAAGLGRAAHQACTRVLAISPDLEAQPEGAVVGGGRTDGSCEGPVSGSKEGAEEGDGIRRPVAALRFSLESTVGTRSGTAAGVGAGAGAGARAGTDSSGHGSKLNAPEGEGRGAYNEKDVPDASSSRKGSLSSKGSRNTDSTSNSGVVAVTPVTIWLDSCVLGALAGVRKAVESATQQADPQGRTMGTPVEEPSHKVTGQGTGSVKRGRVGAHLAGLRVLVPALPLGGVHSQEAWGLATGCTHKPQATSRLPLPPAPPSAAPLSCSHSSTLPRAPVFSLDFRNLRCTTHPSEADTGGPLRTAHFESGASGGSSRGGGEHESGSAGVGMKGVGSVVSVEEILLWSVTAPGRGDAAADAPRSHAAALQCILTLQGPSAEPIRRPSPAGLLPGGLSSPALSQGQGPALEASVEHRGHTGGESNVSVVSEAGIVDRVWAHVLARSTRGDGARGVGAGANSESPGGGSGGGRGAGGGESQFAAALAVDPELERQREAQLRECIESHAAVRASVRLGRAGLWLDPHTVQLLHGATSSLSSSLPSATNPSAPQDPAQAPCHSKATNSSSPEAGRVSLRKQTAPAPCVVDVTLGSFCASVSTRVGDPHAGAPHLAHPRRAGAVQASALHPHHHRGAGAFSGEGEAGSVEEGRCDREGRPTAYPGVLPLREERDPSAVLQAALRRVPLFPKPKWGQGWEGVWVSVEGVQVRQGSGIGGSLFPGCSFLELWHGELQVCASRPEWRSPPGATPGVPAVSLPMPAPGPGPRSVCVEEGGDWEGLGEGGMRVVLSCEQSAVGRGNGGPSGNALAHPQDSGGLLLAYVSWPGRHTLKLPRHQFHHQQQHHQHEQAGGGPWIQGQEQEEGARGEEEDVEALVCGSLRGLSLDLVDGRWDWALALHNTLTPPSPPPSPPSPLPSAPPEGAAHGSSGLTLELAYGQGHCNGKCKHALADRAPPATPRRATALAFLVDLQDCALCYLPGTESETAGLTPLGVLRMAQSQQRAQRAQQQQRQASGSEPTAGAADGAQREAEKPPPHSQGTACLVAITAAHAAGLKRSTGALASHIVLRDSALSLSHASRVAAAAAMGVRGARRTGSATAGTRSAASAAAAERNGASGAPRVWQMPHSTAALQACRFVPVSASTPTFPRRPCLL